MKKLDAAYVGAEHPYARDTLWGRTLSGPQKRGQRQQS